MGVQSTKGLTIWLEKGGVDVPTASKPEIGESGVTRTNLSPSAATNTVNAEFTFDGTAKQADGSSAITVSPGDLVYVNKSGYPTEDGKIYIVNTVTGQGTASAKFSLIDFVATNGQLNTTDGEFFWIGKEHMVKLCLSTINITNGTPNTISVGTFCVPDASLPGNPTAGSITFGGYTDIADPGYIELLKAEDDGKQRYLKIDVPGQGHMLGSTQIGSVSWELPLEGSSSYTFNAAMSSPLKHVFLKV